MPLALRQARYLAATVALLGTLALAACDRPTADRDYIVRLGDAVLTPSDLSDAIAAIPAGVDSVTASEQFIEQWMTTQLLAEEARRRGLRDDPDVQKQLYDNERNVLAAAMLGSMYEDERALPGRADVEAYFERNRDRLRLREAYVRVRFIEAQLEQEASGARSEMQEMMRAGGSATARDSIFLTIASRFAMDTTAAQAMASSYVPQSRLARQVTGAPWSIVAQMGPGEISPVLVTADSTYFVVQLVDRVPAGSEPRLEWVLDDIERQVVIQHRQQLVAREVQRLRTEAEARGDLRIPHRQEDRRSRR